MSKSRSPEDWREPAAGRDAGREPRAPERRSEGAEAEPTPGAGGCDTLMGSLWPAPGGRCENAPTAASGERGAPDGAGPSAAGSAGLVRGRERSGEDERRRGVTVVGPHRDEISFSIDGREARDFASQGQQRSLVLAWKIAEAEVASDILGRYPMLLLDDVMSELDARRREAITGFVQGEIQTIITTTNLGYFSNDVIDRAKVVHIDGEKK